MAAIETAKPPKLPMLAGAFPVETVDAVREAIAKNDETLTEFLERAIVSALRAEGYNVTARPKRGEGRRRRQRRDIGTLRVGSRRWIAEQYKSGALVLAEPAPVADTAA
jgi:hypothetical protein